MAYVGNDRALTQARRRAGWARAGAPHGRRPPSPLCCPPTHSQIELGEIANLRLSSQFAYLLWKAVYLTKQASAPPAWFGGARTHARPRAPNAPPARRGTLRAQVSFRNRVLILLDWLKARVFGRDLSQF